ncbi:hypothetical protein [Nocardioides sp. TF02-7]|uniref:hypothetical protein n=1 Tax=Nocardioides sp. TF02-7 TaxID=2917724 RepID=UPI001F06DB8C|nr:hypothetical protein [Nocardioides sp. TF02-7]UMG94623.1 hypothetical protein MF408_12170 [Nocardioides sp. TF02-7]
MDLADPSSADVEVIWPAGADNRAWQRRYQSYTQAATADWVMSDVDGDGDDDLVFLRFGDFEGVDADSRPVTVRLAQDGELAPPAPWGRFECGADCSKDYSPVTPAY